MRFEIEGQKTTTEHVAKAKLSVGSDGTLSLIIDGYYVLEIGKSGFGRLVRSVQPETGLQVDESGRLILKDKI